MSKQTKTMVAMCGLLLVLLIAFASIVIYSGQQENTDENTAEDGIVISRLKKEDIAGFSFQVNNEDFDDGVYAFKKVGDTWYYNEDEQFPVNQSVADAKTTVLSELTAKRVIEKQTDDLSKYGLDTPIVTVSVTNGTSVITYLVGDYNANSETYYLKVKDQNEIYTVDGTLWMAFSMELYDFANIEEFPEIQTDHIVNVTIENAKNVARFSFQREGSETDEETGVTTYKGTWYVETEAGELVKANQSKTELLMSILANMEYASLVDYDCSAEDITAYGLNEPAVQITVNYTVDEVLMDTVQKVEVCDGVNVVEYETESVDHQLTMKIGDSSEAVNFKEEYFLWVNDGKSMVTIDADTAAVLAGIVGEEYAAQ